MVSSATSTSSPPCGPVPEVMAITVRISVSVEDCRIRTESPTANLLASTTSIFEVAPLVTASTCVYHGWKHTSTRDRSAGRRGAPASSRTSSRPVAAVAPSRLRRRTSPLMLSCACACACDNTSTNARMVPFEPK